MTNIFIIRASSYDFCLPKIFLVCIYNAKKNNNTDLPTTVHRNYWDHYYEDGDLVPSPQCGFSFEAAFQLWGVKLTISVYIRNATLW